MQPKHFKGETGAQPVCSFVVSRRNLPHWQEPGSIYFVTWRCWKGATLAPEERIITLDCLRYWDQRKLVLYASVVMPNHIHALVQILPKSGGTAVFNLSEIMHSVKSFSAHRINKLRGKEGSLWQDERFDRIVRDEEEFLEKWGYIRNNPVKAGLAAVPEEYPWLYERKVEPGPEAGAKSSNGLQLSK